MNQQKILQKSRSIPPINQETNILYSVIREFEQKQDYQKIILDATKKFQIKQYNILTLTPQKVVQVYQNIKSKFYSERNDQENVDQWYDNELRLFIWLYVCYLNVFKRSQDDMTKKDWIQFANVFKGKSLFLFQFQAKVIKKLNKKSKKWMPEQDQCLFSIISYSATLLAPIQTYKWSQIAKRLFIESNKKYFRTPKQCRERWMNHLDPGKSKQKWTTHEDFILIDNVMKQGKKWATIAKLMGNKRTQHTVKNRYNSILRNEMKKHDQLADQTRVIKKLHSRIKYTLQIKNTEKEHAIKIQNVEEDVERMTISNLQQYLKEEEGDYLLLEFDELLQSIKKESRTSYDLVQIPDDPVNLKIQDFNIEFDFKPEFPDCL